PIPPHSLHFSKCRLDTDVHILFSDTRRENYVSTLFNSGRNRLGQTGEQDCNPTVILPKHLSEGKILGI
ncbi:hypothetical protein, partial [Sutterella wadsworthensis]|uniref:hypothetical protein n=1 Tax=Sutterella wadsworthensis TaxID=40545 RepID=UPI003C6F5BA4